MNISINKEVALITIALILAFGLTAGIVNAEEYGEYSDIADIEAIVEDADMSEIDFEIDMSGLGDEELDNMDFIDSEDDYVDNLDDIDIEDIDFETDFLDPEGELLDSYEDFNSPEWDDISLLIEEEDIVDDIDVDWEQILPVAETGEVHVVGRDTGDLFGIFDITFEVSRLINADGEVGEIDRPWYSFLLW